MPIFFPTIQKSWSQLLYLICDSIFEDIPLEKSLITLQSQNMLMMISLLKEQGYSKEKIIKLFEKSEITTEYIQNSIKKVIEEMNINTYRILCLTTEYDNEHMWVNYSDNHSGCVLAFQHIKEKDTPLLVAKQVNYIDGERIVASGMDLILHGDTPQLRTKTLDSICFTKNIKWANEKEWRAITREQNSQNKYKDYKFYSEELESVTFGVNIKDKNKMAIIDLIKSQYPTASMYQMIFNEKLQRVKFNS